MDPSRAAPVHVGVGIDTARYGHHVAFVGEDRQEAAKDFTFLESAHGYAELEAALRKISQRHGGAVHFEVRIDAAGQYATNLEVFLRRLELAMTISVGEPKRNRDYKNVHYPKRKADEVDSRACARYAIVERPTASAEVPEAMRQLREVSRVLSSQKKQTTRHLNQLHNLLARVFPELATMMNRLSAQWVLELLAKYPSAKRIAAARSLSAIAHVEEERAKQIQSIARTTTASLEGAVVEALVVQGVEAVRHSQQAERKLEDLLVQAYDALGEGGHQQLVTIKGIGKKTAAALAGQIVSIDRFETPAQLVSYFGAFPQENTSGVDKYGTPVSKGSMQMSNKGNDLVRGLLWMACQSGIQCNPALRALYARHRAVGKRGDVALGHCMRKMLHLVFAVWKTNQPFDPTHYRWEAPADEGHEVNSVAGCTQPACAAEQIASATNELATRNISDNTAPRHDAQSLGPDSLHTVPAVATIDQPVISSRSQSESSTPRRSSGQQRKTAGRKEAMPPSKAVTAATNELATRKLSAGSGPNKPAKLATETASQPGSTVWVDFAHLRAQITMEQVLSKLGVLDRMRGPGPQRRGPCPIHGGEGSGGRPFSVNLGKNVFRCLNAACAAQGNTLDLWAATRHLALREAAIDLAETFHLQLAPIKRATH